MAMLAVVISLYASYNGSIVNKMDLTQQKAKEKLTIKQATITDNQLDISLSNLGDQELKVRAIYLKNQDNSAFAGDPNTIIAPHRTEEVTVTIPEGMNDFSIIASTDLGTLSKAYFIPTLDQNLIEYDTENIMLGSLKLRFQSFEYSIYQDKQWSDWAPGWAPPTGEYIKWRVDITNISNETITLNNKSSLVLSSCDGPSETAWYIAVSPLILPPDTETPIIFQYAEDTGKDKLAKILTLDNQMVFLTFFGETQSTTGTTPFGQTLPFLSAIPGGT